MGVTVLQQFPMTENRTGPQTIEFLTKRVVALGAIQTGQFLVDCETYQSVSQLGSPRTVHVLHNSEQPASVFAVLESGTKVVPLIADGLFDLLMLKMTSIYTSKKQTKVEAKGPRFEIGDFCVKLGSVTMSQNFKGVLVEDKDEPTNDSNGNESNENPKSIAMTVLSFFYRHRIRVFRLNHYRPGSQWLKKQPTSCLIEYRPCVIPGSSWELMREFLQGFLGSAVPNQAPQYLQNRMNEIYQPMDTIQQYLEHFGQYRKSSGVL